jgi:hypothetical protein
MTPIMTPIMTYNDPYNDPYHDPYDDPYNKGPFPRLPPQQGPDAPNVYALCMYVCMYVAGKIGGMRKKRDGAAMTADADTIAT